MVSATRRLPREGLHHETMAPTVAETTPRESGFLSWSMITACAVAMFVVLSFLPFRALIAPWVESDYCYQLIAADRMYEGLGFTAPAPVAPLQPWTWRYDWGFLTKWPVGYSALVWMVRSTLGGTTIEACQWIGVAACALALVGWYVWVRRCIPTGLTGGLIAAVAAGSSVSVALLANPSTDALLVALLPFSLLLVQEGIDFLSRGDDPYAKRRAGIRLALGGLMAGGLFWIRYASIFLPLAVGLYLLWKKRCNPPQAMSGRTRLSWRHLFLWAGCAAGPMIALVILNRAMAPEDTLSSQFNLGSTVEFSFSVSLLLTAWWRFTDLGFYDYHAFSHWVYALWPLGLLAVALSVRRTRQVACAFLSRPGVGLSVTVVTVFFSMLIAATVLFGQKFHYVGLDRYYLSVRPMYFLLFAGPLVMFRWRWVRVAASIGLLIACSWIVQQNGRRAYVSRLTTRHTTTPQGQWSRCFEPGASELYHWLCRQASPELVVVSNFHEYIAMETKIPAIPIPPKPSVLNGWLERISRSRGVKKLHVLFVLDRSNRWRDYWIADPAEIVRSFPLTRKALIPARISAQVFEYHRLADG